MHKHAIIDPNAQLGEGVTVGPWSVIGPDVVIGAGTKIAAHVVISGPTRIGRNNQIFPFASLGQDPQHLAYQGEITRLEIGDDNIIREHCSLHRGTQQGGGVTRIGDRNFLMNYVHIAHDCDVGNDVIFVNNASLAGHVQVANNATLGAFTGIHQYCSVGAYSFVTRAAIVGRDVLPFLLISGNPPAVYGLNKVGLRRHGFSRDTIAILHHAYKILYREGHTVQESLPLLSALAEDCPEVQLFLSALQASKRGILR